MKRENMHVADYTRYIPPERLKDQTVPILMRNKHKLRNAIRNMRRMNAGDLPIIASLGVEIDQAGVCKKPRHEFKRTNFLPDRCYNDWLYACGAINNIRRLNREKTEIRRFIWNVLRIKR